MRIQILLIILGIGILGGVQGAQAMESGRGAGHGWAPLWEQALVRFVRSHWELGGMAMAVCLALVVGYRVRSMHTSPGENQIKEHRTVNRPNAPLSPEQRYETAYRLATKGWSVRDIAREVGISQREVNLVIKL